MGFTVNLSNVIVGLQGDDDSRGACAARHRGLENTTRQDEELPGCRWYPNAPKSLSILFWGLLIIIIVL